MHIMGTPNPYHGWTYVIGQIAITREEAVWIVGMNDLLVNKHDRVTWRNRILTRLEENALHLAHPNNNLVVTLSVVHFAEIKDHVERRGYEEASRADLWLMRMLAMGLEPMERATFMPAADPLTMQMPVGAELTAKDKTTYQLRFELARGTGEPT